MPDRRYLVLVNPRARNGARAAGRVEELLRQAGGEVVTVYLKQDVDASAVLDSEARGMDAVLIVGGDGTLDRAVRGVLASGLPLGVIPVGTSNSLARALELPLEVDRAVDVVLAGHTARIDVAEVNGNPFLGIAVLGNSLETAINQSMAEKDAYGRARQLACVVRFLARARIFMATLTYADARGRQEHSQRLLQVVVANNHPFKEASGLDVYALRVTRWRDLARLLPMLMHGIRALWPAVEHRHATELEIYTRASMPVYADDRVLAQTPAVFKTRPKAVRVFVGEHARLPS